MLSFQVPRMMSQLEAQKLIAREYCGWGGGSKCRWGKWEAPRISSILIEYSHQRDMIIVMSCEQVKCAAHSPLSRSFYVNYIELWAYLRKSQNDGPLPSYSIPYTASATIVKINQAPLLPHTTPSYCVPPDPTPLTGNRDISAPYLLHPISSTISLLPSLHLPTSAPSWWQAD